MMRRLAFAAAAVALTAAAGAGLWFLVSGGDEVAVVSNTSSSVAGGSTVTSARATASTTTTTETHAFPAAIPRAGDEECSVPRTDPDRPGIPEVGEPADGIEVTSVTVTEPAPGDVVFTAATSHRPVVKASSGAKWVLIELNGVRRVDLDNVVIETDHAQPVPSSLCDDSAWSFAYAFDQPVTGMELVTHTPDTVEIVIRLG